MPGDLNEQDDDGFTFVGGDNSKTPQLLDVNPLLLAGAAAMLVVGALVVIVASTYFDGDSSLWFIGFILISLSALALTAAVFRGLGYRANESEAFGLPSGSIRAVIAIAIMVLLLIFGLPYVSSDPGTKVVNRTALDRDVLVSCERVESEVKRYEAVGLIPVLDARACQPQAPAGATASIAIYGRSRQSDPLTRDRLETSRQLLTAIITLLTTIIGFYFGSQQALNLVTALNAKNSGENSQGGGNRPDPNAGRPTPEMEAEKRRLEEQREREQDKKQDSNGGREPNQDAVVHADIDEDCCPSDAEPIDGESVTTDENLPEASGGVAAAEARATAAPTDVTSETGQRPATA